MLGYQVTKAFGGDALRGNTRSHPEHDGKDLSGRWYCTGDGVGEQVAASFKRGRSSVGRAPALQAGGQEFESLRLHRRCNKTVTIDIVP